jgi:hypothetical protein
VIVPSSTQKASEQFTCRCGSGRRPRGGTVRSIREKSPPVCSAMALNAMTLPRAVTILPFPAGMMLGSVTKACLRLPVSHRKVTPATTPLGHV